jgi:hypothetical protein
MADSSPLPEPSISFLTRQCDGRKPYQCGNCIKAERVCLWAQQATSPRRQAGGGCWSSPSTRSLLPKPFLPPEQPLPPSCAAVVPSGPVGAQFTPGLDRMSLPVTMDGTNADCACTPASGSSVIDAATATVHATSSLGVINAGDVSPFFDAWGSRDIRHSAHLTAPNPT